MARRPDLTPDEIRLIVGLKELGWRHEDVAVLVHCSVDTVVDVMAKARAGS